MNFDTPVSMRDGFGQALLELGEQNQRVVALSADVSEPTRVHWFARKFPERFFQMGISENEMIGTASGMALNGLIPFATTFAIFAASLAHQPMRVSAAYARANVKIVASHGGVTIGADGATHQAYEDLGLMRLIPGMTVLAPCDARQTYHAVFAAAEYDGPIYMRVGRVDEQVITSETDEFNIGKIQSLREGSDVAILANGIMVSRALEAARILAGEGMNAAVINVHTLKPFDTEGVLHVLKTCGAAVTVEEHTVLGGLGGAVSECSARNYPVPVESIGVQDVFGESGDTEEVLGYYGLTVPRIADAARQAVARKQSISGK